MQREQSLYTRFRRERSGGVDIQYHVERGDYSITTFDMSFALRELGVRQRFAARCREASPCVMARSQATKPSLALHKPHRECISALYYGFKLWQKKQADFSNGEVPFYDKASMTKKEKRSMSDRKHSAHFFGCGFIRSHKIACASSPRLAQNGLGTARRGMTFNASRKDSDVRCREAIALTTHFRPFPIGGRICLPSMPLQA
jgi:hypothetical protein